MQKSHLKRVVHPHCAIVVPNESVLPHTIMLPPIPDMLKPKSFNPELLYVECGRCGSPVIWEKGRATLLLKEAGIDPLELDAHCLLVTDACPMCSSKRKQYTVQIFRVSTTTDQQIQPFGNA